MKKVFFFLLVFIFGLSIMAYSNKNEDAAKKYCKEMEEKDPDAECKVSAWVGCGPGWTKDKAFRGTGKDYFACKRTKLHKKQDEGTEKHLKQAEDDCKKIRAKGTKCKVERLINCGPQWKKVTRYSGLGKDYSVCVPGNRFVDAMRTLGKLASKLIMAPLNIHKSICGALQKKVPGMVCSLKDITKCPPGTKRVNKLQNSLTEFIPLCVPDKDFGKNMTKLGLQEAGTVDGMKVYHDDKD
jgi:hypothetical protein